MPISKSVTNEYRTKDLSEAALLYAKEIKFIKADKSINGNNSAVWFVFENQDNKAQEIIKGFYNRVVMVNAKAFSDGMRTMKDIIFGRG